MNALFHRTTVVLIVILMATTLAYLPGLWGPFLFDDKPNLLNNPYVYLRSLDWPSLREAAFSNRSGLFHRPIASLSFALNYYAADGFVSFPFKLTNLIIHALNGCLIFLLSRQICARLRQGNFDHDGVTDPTAIVPIVVTAFWLLHPLQLTSVLYVVQRMTSLSAFFTLAGLLLYMHGRERVERDDSGGFSLMIAGIVGAGGLGVLCKENAALIPVYALVLELSCFGRSVLDRARRLRVRLFFMVVLGLPALAALAYMIVNPNFIFAAYESRAFSLSERLLTQPRVLFYYLGLALFPTRNALGLYHDDFVTSTALLEPATTLLALVGWAILVALAVVLRRRAPVLFLGAGWFLGGHLMESSIFGLEMVHEHRNYLPIFGILFSLVYAMRILFKRAAIDRRIGATVIVLMGLTLGFVTHSRAYNWSSTGLLLETLVKHHPQAPRSHASYAEEIINTRGDIYKAYYHLQQYSRLQPDGIVGLAEMVRIAKGMLIADFPSEEMPVGAGGQSGVLEISLVNHPERLEKIARQATAELERRIEVYPITANTVKTFVDLQHCLYRGTQVCVEMASDLVHWMELALKNPKTTLRFRAVLLMTTAKTYSWIGELDKAVEYAELSVETLPKNVDLSIDLVKLHLALGNYARGLEITEAVKRKKKLIGYRMDEVRALEVRLKTDLSHAPPGS